MNWLDEYTGEHLTAEENQPRYSSSVRYSQNPIVVKTFDFAVSIVAFAETLQEQRKFAIGNQVLRSGPSIGANVREAQNAESRADFIHKIKLALKEADETEYWLLLCQASENYPNTSELTEQLQPILKILNKIIQTSKQRKS
ncbi:MAG: four helix bundle protein [Flavobacteriales bacterium]|nr:four helix bundle protein [Flavobacteriales bacterium]